MQHWDQRTNVGGSGLRNLILGKFVGRIPGAISNYEHNWESVNEGFNVVLNSLSMNFWPKSYEGTNPLGYWPDRFVGQNSLSVLTVFWLISLTLISRA